MSILKEQFTISASRFSQDSILTDLLWRKIESKYNAGSRYYHTLDHLDHVTKMLLPFKEAFSNWDVITFAIAYHDVVYKPIRNDNEERSSAFAADALGRLGVDDGYIKRCQELIMATQAHKPADDETNLFTDADLSILGSDPASYDLYSKNVRKEYGIFPDLIYNPGRKKVLEHFLSMDVIFKTPEFRGSLENQARENLQRELLSF